MFSRFLLWLNLRCIFRYCYVVCFAPHLWSWIIYLFSLAYATSFGEEDSFAVLFADVFLQTIHCLSYLRSCVGSWVQYCSGVRNFTTTTDGAVQYSGSELNMLCLLLS